MCGLTKLLYKGINVDCDLSVKFPFIIPNILLAFLIASQHLFIFEVVITHNNSQVFFLTNTLQYTPIHNIIGIRIVITQVHNFTFFRC